MRDLVNPIWNLFDAAVRHQLVRLACPRCKKVADYDPHAMWWLFERKGWNESLKAAHHRFYCQTCHRVTGYKLRPGLEILDRGSVSAHLPMPSERELKQALRRRR